MTFDNTLSIRKATTADAKEISNLIISCLRETNAKDYSPDIIDRVVTNFTPEKVTALIESRDVFIATQNNLIIGTVNLEQSNIRSLFVLPEKQNCGVGAHLMQHVETIAKEQGCNLLTVPSSVTAEGFYKKLGYKTLRDEYYGTERTIIMKKRIKAPSPTKDVEVVPYDPSWPNVFDIEAKKIKAALGNSFAAIHHVGSTSVPGLAAKPKIDIIACVNHLDFDHQGLANLNYEYRGGFNLPLRKSFTYRSTDLNVNLHIFEENDPEVELNLLFRDYLHKNVQARDQYAALKYQLLEDDASHKKDGAMYRGYTLGKHDLIQDILNKSGFKSLRFVICTHYTEWSAAKQFRNKYFFEPNKIEDPYTWTFDHKDHKHFILYKGVNIVGYAHVQLWQENRAALRIIVIDEKEQGKGYGREFMSLIEKWLRLESYKSIHTESSPAALKFYQAINYVKMPFDDPDGYEGSPDDIEMGKLL